MLRIWLLCLCPLLVALLAAPVVLVAGKSGQRDAANLYVVINLHDEMPAAFATIGAREIGPDKASFARLINANPPAHAKLVDSGYWVIPASTLAAFCGLPTTV